MTKSTPQEQRQLTVHPAILYSIIKSQAGTLSKALLEAVMNAVDAGATQCNITLTNTTFQVTDNGKGFSSRQEILEFFEQFGTPHTAGDATYGRFRMGRGQMFAFAANTWRTGSFRMQVDIQKNGLDYALEEKLPIEKGCIIDGTLYDELSSWQLQDYLTELKQYLRYTQIPVMLNKVLVSKDPASLKWDTETEDAYFKLNSTNTLAVYNLGVLVREYGAYHVGSGGVVVSKKALDVNFARNDILTHSCTVWKAIRKTISDTKGTKLSKKASLTSSEREFMAKNFVSELDTSKIIETYYQVAFIPTSASRMATPAQLYAAKAVVLVPEEHNRLGEQIHRRRDAFCITPITLDRFNCDTAEQFLALFNSKFIRLYRSADQKIAEFSTYLSQYKAGFDTANLSELSPVQKLAFSVLENAHSKYIKPWLTDLRNSKDKLNLINQFSFRTLRPGASDSALAWTNGVSSIHYEVRSLAKDAKKGLNGWHRVAMILLHEYCHGAPDTDQHMHDQDFFELFEELATSDKCRIAQFAVYATKLFNQKAVLQGIRLDKTTLYQESDIPNDLVTEVENEEPQPKVKKVGANKLKVAQAGEKNQLCLFV
ncbi:MAG: ATP-binding protein [Candidatus Nanopelagicales bacterium]